MGVLVATIATLALLALCGLQVAWIASMGSGWPQSACAMLCAVVDYPLTKIVGAAWEDA